MSLDAFDALFGRPAEATGEAPGRVNLIGEHTDYNDGFVLPMAIPQRTRVELARSDSQTVRVWSASLDERQGYGTYILGNEERRASWIDYVAGVTWALRESGHQIGGFHARIESAVPLGSGLSSSAALLVALLRALRAVHHLEIDDTSVAALAHRAETTFVGAPVGIMDQMVASLGKQGEALFLDTRTRETRHVPIPRGAEIVVINSNVHHAHASGEYRTRRRECEEAAARLGVGTLRELGDDAAAMARVATLPELLHRRARHVVTENGRVLGMTRALERGDLKSCGALLVEGHRSLRDDFEVSVPEIDFLVERAAAQPGIHGARLTGGGFGGSIVGVADRGAGRHAAEAVALEYSTRFGRSASILLPVTRPAPPAPAEANPLA
jgi:galactokinase